MLSLPRPGAAVPNPGGTRYLQTYSQFDFQEQRTTRSIVIGNLDEAHTGEIHRPKDFLTDLRYGEAAWIDDETVLYLRPPGAQVGMPDHPPKVSDDELAKEDKLRTVPGLEVWAKSLSGEEYQIGYLPVEVTNVKTCPDSESKAVLAFSASVYPEEPELAAVKRLDEKYDKELDFANVRIYDSLFVRHWDEWKSAKVSKIFFVRLGKSRSDGDYHDCSSLVSLSDSDSEDGFPESTTTSSSSRKWTFESEPKTPMASGAPSLECPVGRLGSSDDYDISSTHLLFTSKDPLLPEAWHTRVGVCLVPLDPASENDKIRVLSSAGGARSCPRFDTTAKRGSLGAGKIAWLEMREDGYEADRNRVVVYDLETSKRHLLTEKWDRSPTALAWNDDSSTLYLAAEDQGHRKLFSLEVDLTTRGSKQLINLTHKHTVHTFFPLPKRVSTHFESDPARLLVTINSFTSPDEVFLLTVSSTSESPTLTLMSTFVRDLVHDLGLDAGEEFRFAGARKQDVHGFILRPPSFDASKKYPLAFIVHGGPQSANSDSWSTRWNPNAFTAAGYIVIMINPTGSTGYGQEFTDDIQDDWGGKPFKDLLAGLKVAKTIFHEIDENRMVMLGASYGGYMANWIQGHNDVMGFKAIVCHDGVANPANAWYSGEELYFPEHDLGIPYENPAAFERWNPLNHVHKWATPQLIIHGGKDYRLPVTEGLTIFNTLQRRGIPSRFVYFEDENHWVLKPANSLRWHKEVLRFMDEWVGSDKK